MKHAAGLQTIPQICIWRMNGTWNETVLGPLSGLAKINQQDISGLQKPSGIGRGDGPATACKLVLRQTNLHIEGTATSIIFGLGKLRLFISATYSSTDLTCRRGLQAFSSPIVLTVSPL